MMERKIRQVHFQITRNCNLRCTFCGQWGRKGFFADSRGEEMSLENWKDVISQLEEYRSKTGENICITVWGGEPLVSPFFDELMTILKEKGFMTEVITNGVLIDKHRETLKNYADSLYISLDGTEKIHDSVRGSGVYKKVTENLKELKHENVIVMSVITKELTEVLPQFLNELDGLGIKTLYLQDMIGLTADEIKAYRAWMKNAFDIEAADIFSWENNERIFFGDIVDDILKNAEGHSYTVEHKMHTDSKAIYCASPFRHIHITWNGNVTYCTDFYDFKAGNVKTDTVENIFLNEKSEIFRREIENGRCITCNHCSWKCKEIRNY